MNWFNEYGKDLIIAITSILISLPALITIFVKQMNIKSRTKELSNKLDAQEQIILELKKMLEVKNSEIMQLNFEIKRYDEIIRRYENKLAYYQQNGANESEVIRELEKQLNHSNEQLSLAFNEIKKLSNEVAELRAAKEKANLELSKLKIRNTELEKDFEAKNNIMAQVENIVNLIQSKPKTANATNEANNSVLDANKSFSEKMAAIVANAETVETNENVEQDPTEQALSTTAI